MFLSARLAMAFLQEREILPPSSGPWVIVVMALLAGVALGNLAQIPADVEEAAMLDGATAWQRLRHVVLPLLIPSMLPSVVLGAVWTFNMFNIIFLVSGGEPDGATEILVSQAYRWAFTRGHRYGYAAAYAVLIFAVLAIQSALSRRATPEVDV